MSAKPWTQEKRDQVKRKIDKEAVRSAKRLGASGVAIIAFFSDGEHMHMQDGGAIPAGMSAKDFYSKLAGAHEMVDQSDGEDITIN